MFTANSFAKVPVPDSTKELLAESANHALSRSTWSTYRTAQNHLEACQREAGRRMELPLSGVDVLAFTSWLLEKRGVRGVTVDAYLSALRQVHLAKGVEPPNLRPEMVKMVVQGRKHMEAAQDRAHGRITRLPVTVDMLKLLKAELADSAYPFQRKRLVWTVCSLNFFGGFRVHETLSKFEGHFDPAFCLLGRDIEVKEVLVNNRRTEILQLKLKSPKEDRIGTGSIIVDVYETGGILCPVRAYKKWISTNPPRDQDLPAFRDESGVPFTGRRLNSVLKECLEKHIPYESGVVTSHSFRAGIASLMGVLGYSDDQIMAIGRWSSSAFERYLKLPRTKRAQMAKELGKLR